MSGENYPALSGHRSVENLIAVATGDIRQTEKRGPRLMGFHSGGGRGVLQKKKRKKRKNRKKRNYWGRLPDEFETRLMVTAKRGSLDSTHSFGATLWGKNSIESRE